MTIISILRVFRKGSMKVLLSNKEEVVSFDWIKRVNLVRVVADASSYMHHNFSPPIVHRNISSKNILLDSKYEAHISDFGTTRFLKPDSSNWTSFARTFGYTAPGNIIFSLLTCLANMPFILQQYKV